MKTIRILTISVIFGLIVINAAAQDSSTVHVKAGYGVPVLQTEPEFPGGADSLKAFIHSNLKYPQQLIDSRTGGNIMILFIVDKDGKIIDPIVLKGVNEVLNEEALRVVKLMPDWKPGTNGGIPVEKQSILQVDFAPPGKY